MPTLVTDCPRCETARITFDILGKHLLDVEYGWKLYFEVYSICRSCSKGVIFRISSNSADYSKLFTEDDNWKKPLNLNDFFLIEGYISVKDMATVLPPDFVPEDIATVFREGAACLSLQCFNAAGAMFRLVLDMATKGLLPEDDSQAGPNRRQRHYLSSRLQWLFDNDRLPRSLQELADCVREDGNDAAHDGTLAKADAEDLIEFSRILLERIYTEPARLQQAKERRDQRRA